MVKVTLKLLRWFNNSDFKVAILIDTPTQIELKYEFQLIKPYGCYQNTKWCDTIIDLKTPRIVCSVYISSAGTLYT